MHTTPAGPYEVYTVEATGNRGRLDTGGCSLYFDADADDTTLYVVTDTGPDWRTTAASAQTPFDVGMGGERFTITAVAGAPTFVSVGTVDHDVNAALTPGLPASMQGADEMVLLAGIRNSGAGTVDTPAGWERITTTIGSPNVALFRKTAGGVRGVATTESVGPTVTFTGGVAGADTSAQIAAWRGLSSVLDTQTAIQLNASAQNILYPTHKARAGTVAILAAWKQDDWTSVAPPSPFIEIAEPDTTTGNDQGLYWAYSIQTTATAIPAGTITVTGGGAAISRAFLASFRGIQTLTATRSVNGIVKSHEVGAGISLWRPGRYAR